MIEILIAPNAFKESLDAPAASAAIARGLETSNLDCVTRCRPLGDGGDGTGAILAQVWGATARDAAARDAVGRPGGVTWWFVERTRTAIIEAASVIGLAALAPQDRDPLIATSYGVGQLIREALDAGAEEIVLCLGGTATVDGGMGLLRALGAELRDSAGDAVSGGAQALSKVACVDLSGFDGRIRDVRLVALCDVDNPLSGPTGAAETFAAQKGASPSSVRILGQGLECWERVLGLEPGVRFLGAGGGIPAALIAVCGAALVSGADYVMDATGFDDALGRAQLVITGEGAIDEQTIGGKGPAEVARRAARANIPVIGLCGRSPEAPPLELRQLFPVLFPIGAGPGTLEDAREQCAADLERTGRMVGNLLAMVPTMGLAS
jgi:glycerate kinase